MTTTRQTRVVLPEHVLTEVEELAPTEPVLAMIVAWRNIHPDWENTTKVDPKLWAIPTDQWLRIANALARYTPGNAVLGWVNKGPSSFDSASGADPRSADDQRA